MVVVVVMMMIALYLRCIQLLLRILLRSGEVLLSCLEVPCLEVLS